MSRETALQSNALNQVEEMPQAWTDRRKAGAFIQRNDPIRRD